ncbi:hypothetical protein [Jiangella rhizosphaerae]|uniref:hypothetical protein n=1 Tax=Jiangella rhizosphaerae TaxID=2293569 RepID=UPI0013143EA6|nr:hypothetical protein [Jiangella rhizosphaerae]
MTVLGSQKRNSLDVLRDALDRAGHRYQTRGNHIQATCPIHSDLRASLSIDYKPADGKTLMYCHAGCTTVDIVEALGMTWEDVFDEPLPPRGQRARRPKSTRPPKRPANRRGRLPARLVKDQPDLQVLSDWAITATYDYTDIDGQLVSQAVREERMVVNRQTGETLREKQFWQRFPDPGEPGKWMTKAPDGFSPVLWHLADVAAAVSYGEPVGLCEGEKDAKNAQHRTGLVTTTNPGGASNLKAHQLAVFAGAHVLVFIDRDLAGYRRGIQAHKLLTEVGAQSIRLLLPAVLGDHQDLTDHLDEGLGLDDVVEVTHHELAAMALVAEAEVEAGKADKDLEEIRARLQRASQAQQRQATKTAETEQRMAERWAAEVGTHLLKVTAAAKGLIDLPTGPGTMERLRMQRSVKLAQRIAGEAFTESGARPDDDVDEAMTETLDLFPRTEGAEDSGGPAAGGAGAGGGRGGGKTVKGPWPGSGGDDDPVIFGPQYEVLDGEIIRVTDKGLKRVLNLVVTIERGEIREANLAAEDHLSDEAKARRVQPLPTISHYVVGYDDPATGERCRYRVPAREFRSGDWLDDLPIAGLLYDSSKSGRSSVYDAIRAISPVYPVTTVYAATGWRQHGDEWAFIHAGGKLTSSGNVEVPTSFVGPLARYELVDPIDRAEDLRQLWEIAGLDMLNRLGAPIAVPLVGAAYRAVVQPMESSLGLFGVPGTYKTALATLVQHHYGTRWERTTPLLSMTGNGASINGARNVLASCRDVLSVLDDVAPDGGYSDAQKRLSVINRMFFNREEKLTENREKELRYSAPPGGSAMITSEVRGFTASGDQRWFVVELNPGDVQLEDILALDRAEARFARNALLSSFVAWLCPNLTMRREQLREHSGRYAAAIRAAGQGDRVAAAGGELVAGWWLLTEFLLDNGVINADERTQLMGRVVSGITAAAIRQTDPDSPTTTGGRVRRALAEALQSGLIHVTATDGAEPPEPDALRLGWRRNRIGTSHETGEAFYRLEARGKPAGAVRFTSDGARLYLRPASAVAAIRDITSAAGAEMPLTEHVAAVALDELGILTTAEEQGKRRRTVRRSVPGGLARVWDIDLDGLFRDVDDDHGGAQPAPWAPPTAPPSGGNEGGGEDLHDQGGPADSVGPTLDDHPDASTADDSVGPQEGAATSSEEGAVPAWRYGEHTTLSPAQPCRACGEPASVAVDGVPVHIGGDCLDVLDQLVARAAATGADAAADEAQGVLGADTSPASTPAAQEASPGVESGSAAVEPTQEPEAQRDAFAASQTPRSARVSPDQQVVAVVVDVDGVHHPGGRITPLPEQLVHGGQLAQLGHDLGLVWFNGRAREYVQVAVTEAACRAMGVPILTELPDDLDERDKVLTKESAALPFITAAAADGWEPFPGHLAGWSTWRHTSGLAARIILIPYLDDNPKMILKDQPDATTIAKRLDLFARRVGIPYRISAGVTGQDLMQTIKPRSGTGRAGRIEAIDTYVEPCPPAVKPGVEPEMVWTRNLQPSEFEKKYLHVYDRNAHYVAAAGATLLGGAIPAEHYPNGADFDQRRPGFWRIVTPEWDDPFQPDPFPPDFITGQRRETSWVATPTLWWLTNPNLDFGRGMDIEILEAYLWPALPTRGGPRDTSTARTSRYLEGWTAHLREALKALKNDGSRDAEMVLPDVKLTGVAPIGKFAADRQAERQSPLYRPDWRHQVIAQAKSNMRWMIDKIGTRTGQWPIAIYFDALYYVSDDPNPITAWPGNHLEAGKPIEPLDAVKLGKPKPQYSAELTPQVKRLLSRRPYPTALKKLAESGLLIDTADWMASLGTADGERG